MHLRSRRDYRRAKLASLPQLAADKSVPRSSGFDLDFRRIDAFLLGFPQARSCQAEVNQISYPLSTYFFIATVVRVCLSTHTLGIIASKSGSSVTVPRAEFREGGVEKRILKRNFETQGLAGTPMGGTDE
jgi:hypothetical protein